MQKIYYVSHLLQGVKEKMYGGTNKNNNEFIIITMLGKYGKFKIQSS